MSSAARSTAVASNPGGNHDRITPASRSRRYDGARSVRGQIGIDDTRYFPLGQSRLVPDADEDAPRRSKVADRCGDGRSLPLIRVDIDKRHRQPGKRFAHPLALVTGHDDNLAHGAPDDLDHVPDHRPPRDFHEKLVASHAFGQPGRQDHRDETVYAIIFIAHGCSLIQDSQTLNCSRQCVRRS